jgi:hypothetical protein
LNYTKCPAAGFSMGAGSATILMVLLSCVDRQDNAVATSSLYLSRNVGQVLSVAIGSSIVQGVLVGQLTERWQVADQSNVGSGAG